MAPNTQSKAVAECDFPTAPSRTADKFVLSIPATLNLAMTEIARRQYRSYNSEVSLAVRSSLEHHRRLITMRDLLLNRLGQEVGTEVLDGIERIPLGKGALHTSNIRFPDGMRDQLKLAKSGSMKGQIAQACVEWVYFNTQIEALLARCEEPGLKHSTPPAVE